MPVLIPENRAGPTGTKTLRRNYRRHLQRPLNQLITDVRRGIIEEDVFGLRVSADTLAAGDLPPNARLDRDQRKQDLFMQWLEGRVADDVLTAIERDSNTFIRSAYIRGIQDATRMVRAAGGAATPQDVADIFNTPVHQRAVRRQFEKNYAALEDITQEMSRQIGEELATALAAGENPRKVARRITDRIDRVGKTRAATLARTETIEAHSEATLNRYEEIGVDTVSHSEWQTAQDADVCPICERLEGREMGLDEARTGTFTIALEDLADDEPASNAGTYPLRPPAHPNGRCVLLPVIT